MPYHHSQMIAPIVCGALFMLLFYIAIIVLIVKCCHMKRRRNMRTMYTGRPVSSSPIRVINERGTNTYIYSRPTQDHPPQSDEIMREDGEIGGGGGTNIHISSQPISASPVVVPPYPIDARHPTPQMGAPAPGFTHIANPPYPTHTPHPVPMGQAVGFHPMPFGAAPYPPVTAGAPYPPERSAPYPPASGAPYPTGGAGGAPYPPAASTAAPPSYNEAVSKQAPYNPNY